MAERFARGGRLVAFGQTPSARSDARHVAVEFVHPVIVGKRALPAIGLTAEGGDIARQVELIAAAEDIAIAFGTGEDDGQAARAIAVARSRGCLTVAFSRDAGAEWEFEPPVRRPPRPAGAGRDALPRALGARARVLRSPRAADRTRRRGEPTMPARRASCIRSWASRSRRSRRCSTTCAARR